MMLKPKSTTGNEPALVYRRFIGLEKSISLNTVYHTLSDNRYWTFDKETLNTINRKAVNKIYITPNGLSLVEPTTEQYIQKFFRDGEFADMFEFVMKLEDFIKIYSNDTQRLSLSYRIDVTDQSLQMIRVNCSRAIYIRENGGEWQPLHIYPYTYTEYTLPKPDDYTSGFGGDFNIDETKEYKNAEIKIVVNMGLMGGDGTISIVAGRHNYNTYSYIQLTYDTTYNNYFKEISAELASKANNVIPVTDYQTVLSYMGKYYAYSGVDWRDVVLGEDITLLSATFNNIGKYQTNKYYFVGSFDYMIKGSISGTTTQYVKGNIIPLTSLNIKYFDDDINLEPDDLVVIDKCLYAVENPETDIKMQPKPYKIHFATLNSIL